MSKRTILCFGDSLTWGWVPVSAVVPTTRHPREQRWPGVMASLLGDGFEIVEEGLSGRTTTVDDLYDVRLNGSMHLQVALATHQPLDLVIIMLGTNDTKSLYRRTALDIAAGMSRLVSLVHGSAAGGDTVYPAPRVLVVSPPVLGRPGDEWVRSMFDGGRQKTLELAAHYRALARFAGASFLDAAQHVDTDGVDGVHLSADANAKLGAALAAAVAEALG